MKADYQKAGLGHRIRVSGSTRDAILISACNIINRSGMVDFRIDNIAKELGISPGNITYHFPRKEDIATAIWQQCNDRLIANANHYITPLIDIKQLFLLLSHIITTFNSYRGVVCHKSGDLGVIKKSSDQYKKYSVQVQRLYKSGFAHLVANDYLIDNLSEQSMAMIYRSIAISTLWSVNQYITLNGYGTSDKHLNNLVLSILYPLTPYLSEKGRVQFQSILTTCN